MKTRARCEDEKYRMKTIWDEKGNLQSQDSTTILNTRNRDEDNKTLVEVISLKLNKIILKKKVQSFLQRTRIAKNIQDFDDDVQSTRFYEYITSDARRIVDLSQKSTFNNFDLNVFRIFQRETREIKNTLNDVFETLARHHDREFKLKYIELKLFYEDFIEWKVWRIHLVTKMNICYQNFFTKWIKIFYARDHLRRTFYNIVIFRVDSSSINFYVHLSKLIQNLKNIYEKSNKDMLKKKKKKLFNFIFSMRVKNKNEIFEEFLTRFIAITISLQLLESQKISHLKRIISEHLAHKSMHLKNFTFFSKYVKSLRMMISKI